MPQRHTAATARNEPRLEPGRVGGSGVSRSSTISIAGFAAASGVVSSLSPTLQGTFALFAPAMRRADKALIRKNFVHSVRSQGPEAKIRGFR